MELPFSRSCLRSSRSHDKRSDGYIRVDATATATADDDLEEGKKMKTKTKTKTKMKMIRAPKRTWRIKVAPKLGFKMGTLLSSSSLKLWRKLKNGYVNMMLNLANDGTNVFGQKEFPRLVNIPCAFFPSEFQNRMLFEIYKSLLASPELHGGHTLN